MCLSVLPPCMFVYHMHAWCQKSLEEEVEFLGVGITYSCEPFIMRVLGIEPEFSARTNVLNR